MNATISEPKVQTFKSQGSTKSLRSSNEHLLLPGQLSLQIKPLTIEIPSHGDKINTDDGSLENSG